jgi:Tfp pilus assembly protein PilF
MSGPVVFAFAVADGVVPVAGAAPYDVLARQLPRLLVARLNGANDRGARFFPFLSTVDGVRALVRNNRLLEPQALAMVHQQPDAPLVCDGLFTDGALHWRLTDGRSQEVVFARDVPFDPRKPLEILPRLEFEIADRLAWDWRPRPLPKLAGEALGWWLVLKEELLRREANLPDDGRDALRPARRCVELAAADPDVQQLVCEFASSLLRKGERRADCARVLAPLAAVCDDAERLARIDALLLAAGDDGAAADAACRAARLQPERSELVERAAAQAFQLGRYDDVREVVALARSRGTASAAALAQLAAVCDRTDDRPQRGALMRELIGMEDLPVPVARLVVSFLLEEEQPTLARALVDRALQKEPGHAMLHFERARACMLLADEEQAASSLVRALQGGLAPAFVAQAQRLLRVCTQPGLWTGMQTVERALAAGRLDEAATAVRRLVRAQRRSGDAWRLFGVVAHQRGRMRRAESALRRAIRLDDACGEAHNRLGVVLVASGRLDEGMHHLLRAHVLAPSDASPLLHLAQVEALRGRRADAEERLAQAAQLGADPQTLEAVRRQIAGEG